MKKKKWRLTDSSARFYPIFATKKYQSLYRVTALMDGDVDRDRMQKALNLALIRYRVFKVRLKRGYAWHRLIPNDAEAKLFEGDGTLLRPIDFKKTNGYLFRASYDKDLFILDVFHGLTDGSGAQECFDLVVALYKRLESESEEDIIRELESEPPAEGWDEDAFIRHADKISLRDADIKGMAGFRPCRICGTLLDAPKSVGYTANTDDITLKAKALGVSFTSYVLGALAVAVERTAKPSHPIVFMVPVNLKAVFDTQTRQNFTLFARVIFKPQEFLTLEEYAAEAKRQLIAQRDSGALKAQISTTVKGMNNFLMNVVPLFVKSAFAKLGRALLKSRQTVIVSNVGSRDLREHGVKRMSFNVNVSKNNVQNLALLSMGGVSELTFTSLIKEEALPEAFAAVLREHGVNVTKDTL